MLQSVLINLLHPIYKKDFSNRLIKNWETYHITLSELFKQVETGEILVAKVKRKYSHPISCEKANQMLSF